MHFPGIVDLLTNIDQKRFKTRNISPLKNLSIRVNDIPIHSIIRTLKNREEKIFIITRKKKQQMDKGFENPSYTFKCEAIANPMGSYKYIGIAICKQLQGEFVVFRFFFFEQTLRLERRNVSKHIYVRVTLYV